MKKTKMIEIELSYLEYLLKRLERVKENVRGTFSEPMVNNLCYELDAIIKQEQKNGEQENG